MAGRLGIEAGRTMDKSDAYEMAPINQAEARFPCCLVWTPLPVVAWLIPFIGHLGICREDGVILDFAGPYLINVGHFAFGATSRYVELKPEKGCFPQHLSDHTCHSASHRDRETASSWDNALNLAIRFFQHTNYNIFTSNCHSFAARCLNIMAYEGRDTWNIVDLAVMITLKGKWVSTRAAIFAWAPFFIVLALGLYICGQFFLYVWAGIGVTLVGWFLLGTYVFKGVILA
eukprot:TRINITY_DN35477_c0_g1_i1.p1 TRINITY_DN35477_c0_g1~~TRINITY_DN35477_c0_g1_i1.p1  ORF type:complete len:231 (-),score=13.75 TRINITY_DN35477_c0_g1_i1:1110-1802(-)